MNWYTNNGSGGQMMVADEDTGRTVALIYDNGPDTAGTAQLIAAAPDLLDALRRLLDCPDLGLDSLEPETCMALAQARYALDRAEP